MRLDFDTGERELTVMRWGLVPFWSKDGKAAFNTINARAETITTSSLYREPMKRRRCLVPADFFYEWKKLDEKAKQPYSIALKDGSLFAFAGLWDRWTEPADYGRWLEPGDPQHPPIDLLRPYDAEQMMAWKVSASVGNVRNNNPSLIECTE